MKFWLIQSLINVIVLYWLVDSFRRKRQIQRMQRKLRSMGMKIEKLTLQQAFPEEFSEKTEEDLEPRVNTPLAAPVSTLCERVMSERVQVGGERQEALGLLEQGISPIEIARRTGLSISELRLLEKVKHQNP